MSTVGGDLDELKDNTQHTLKLAMLCRKQFGDRVAGSYAVAQGQAQPLLVPPSGAARRRLGAPVTAAPVPSVVRTRRRGGSVEHLPFRGSLDSAKVSSALGEAAAEGGEGKAPGGASGAGGASGVGGAGGAGGSLSRRKGVVHMHEIIMAAPAPVVIVALGPLTNLALLHMLFPETAEMIKSIVVVGGSVGVGQLPGVHRDPVIAQVNDERREGWEISKGVRACLCS